ncbi:MULTISPECIES: hypothetical protein [Streptomyces]|uniref:MFS transporter n=1 Tax=Streptomyces plumbiresistens TaxID=511811 RepID=A0ABP7SP27_9ACTN
MSEGASPDRDARRIVPGNLHGHGLGAAQHRAADRRALGLAVLSTISTSAANDKLPEAAASFYRGLATEDFPLVAKAGEALTHGYTMAFVAAAVMFLAGLAVMFLAVNAGRQQPTEGAPPVHLG